MPVPRENQSKVMNPEESTYALIERYLNRECSANEAKSIEARIVNDQAFADEVDWFRQFRDDMKESTSFGILAEIEKMKREDRTRRQRKKKWLVSLIVLAAVGIVVLVAVFFPPTQEVKPLAEESSNTAFEERLQHWKQYLPDQKGLQSLGEGEDTNLKTALQLIEGDQAAKALPHLANYLNNLSEDDDDFEMRLVYGKILLRENFDTEKAMAAFQSVLNSSALPLYKEEANFYLGLTLFLSGADANAYPILQDIADRHDHPYQQQASEIMENSR